MNLDREHRLALRIVIDKAAEWAGDNGYGTPREAVAVYKAVAKLEPLTRRNSESGHLHWTQHIDDNGAWVLRDPVCDYCRVMLDE